MADRASGLPTKEFFVDMITRDISLEDCLLDLIDNSLDGARRSTKHVNKPHAFKGFRVSLRLSANRCEVTDNCGGIPRRLAEKYAFRFGRSDDLPPGNNSIGLYGIGMKRAIFKLGTRAVVHSRLGDRAFDVMVDVDTWKDPNSPWDFPLEGSSVTRPVGTAIDISPLRPDVGTVVADPNFAAALRRTIARDYAFLINRGFEVKIGDHPVEAYPFRLRRGAGFEPMRTVESVGGVSIEIVAGFADTLAESADSQDDASKKPSPYGWYVVCNDRVVLAADKTSRTVWGRGTSRVWHPQYRGFLGIVRMTAKDPTLLPWTTTKRDVDETSPVYRNAIERMASATEKFIRYTAARRGNLELARKKEQAAKLVPVLKLPIRKSPQFPTIAKKVKASTTISYKVDRGELERAKELLRAPDASNPHVGRTTFEFFLDNAGEGM